MSNSDVIIVHSSDLHVDHDYTARLHGGDGTAGLACVLAAARAVRADVVLLVGDTFESHRLPQHVLDRTATSAGARLLRDWLRRPLRSPEAIGLRHAAVDELVANRALRERLPSMRRWVEYAAGAAAWSRHPDRAEAYPDPAPHEHFLWDSGFHFGEWLEPGVPPRPDPAADHSDVATAFLHRSAALLAESARLTGDPVLEAWARRIADGELHTRLPDPPAGAKDELSDLARAINSMAESLERSRGL